MLACGTCEIWGTQSNVAEDTSLLECVIVTGQIVPDILEGHTAFKFSVKQVNKNDCVEQTLC